MFGCVADNRIRNPSRSVLGQVEVDGLLSEAEKIIHAEGEFLAATNLARAAAEVGKHPITLQLRYLQTLPEIAAEKNSTIVFPLPIDLIKGFLDK